MSYAQQLRETFVDPAPVVDDLFLLEAHQIARLPDRAPQRELAAVPHVHPNLQAHGYRSDIFENGNVRMIRYWKQIATSTERPPHMTTERPDAPGAEWRSRGKGHDQREVR